MKRLIITTILLTVVLAIRAQWSQKIVEKKTETGKSSVSMIHYEDSIGYLYFDEGMNSVFYIGNNSSIEFAVNKAASVKKVTGKIELYSENDELVETIEGYQFVAEEEYITLFSDKLNAKGASQYRTTKRILDFAINEKGYVRFIIPMAAGQTFDFKIPCKRIC